MDPSSIYRELKNTQFRISDIETPKKELEKYIKDIVLLRKELGFEIKFGLSEECGT